MRALSPPGFGFRVAVEEVKEGKGDFTALARGKGGVG